MPANFIVLVGELPIKMFWFLIILFRMDLWSELLFLELRKVVVLVERNWSSDFSWEACSLLVKCMN